MERVLMADEIREIKEKVNKIFEACIRFGFFNTVFWFGLGVGAGAEIVKQLFNIIKKLL
jgi:hypothetical protein